MIPYIPPPLPVTLTFLSRFSRISLTFPTLFAHKMTTFNGVTNVPGQRLLPVLVDQRDPKWLFSRIPKSPTHLQDGFRDVTCGEFARAVNRVAAWLDDKFGRSSSFDTLTYLGPSDIRYCMFLLGAAKVGYKVYNSDLPKYELPNDDFA